MYKFDIIMAWLRGWASSAGNPSALLSALETLRTSTYLNIILFYTSTILYRYIISLEQSFECPLNHNAQILVQTAQCRFLCHFTPLTISLPVRSAPFLPSRSPCLPSISHPYYFFAPPPFPAVPLRFLYSLTVDFNRLLLD